MDDPSKRWKFSGGDMPERKFWKECMKAYEDMLIILKVMEKMNCATPKIAKKTLPTRIE